MPLRRLNPPLHLLRAFCTVVRFGGVSRAADALDVTQSAVSKQVQELERWVGVPLFERNRQRLALTPAGERYEQAVRTLLARLEAATLELVTSTHHGGSLRVSALPTFAAQWLVPRLPAFRQRHPRITLHLSQAFINELPGPELDCAIVFGDGHWPGMHAHYIAGNDVALIAPPPGADGPDGPPPALQRPADVAGHALLRHISAPDAWERWAERHGVAGLDPLGGPQLEQFESIIRGVSVGLGVGLVPRCLVRDEIAAGTVAEPLPRGGYTSRLGYWLCHAGDRAQPEALVHFRAWLLEQGETPADRSS
ncbi:LysR substrate-binding domain-containing protein [Paracidovorax konjaci]|uniref:DNA-binding transcriptional regulator, LysR family n=1 Tax=Paracidovorax konjaci TaxID=32040 RepID=A0A1I1W3R1_9BURK|nr:LysR substrate-binding domain-containing protein [Paracidovorax konjaci]SFD89896.1 DNA-binding transcriptional regulator, LysR family [Paracidovorax konjaci]